ncbi:MAG: aldehyde dehydrogenase family protein [Chthonomonas sp.]|nr:aldehyde dehydrogenase family protein [Chthonomonas sp.]
MIHRELLINGVFIGGPCDQSVSKQVVRSPWDGTVIGTAAEASGAEAFAAIACAQQTFPVWRETPIAERQALMHRVSEAIGERRQELAELLCLEVGKPIRWAEGEVERARITFLLSATTQLDSSPLDLSADPRGAQYDGSIRNEPRGVVLAIAPYNWPLNLAAHKLGPALVTGNTVVLKGSNLASLSTLTLARIIHEAGCPPGVLNAVQTMDRDAQRMTDADAVQVISFTGSERVGWSIRERHPDKHVLLELGGNAAAIIAADAALDRVVETLVPSAFGFAGQVCISAQHVFAHRSVYDEVVDRLTEAARQVQVGDPRSTQTLLGPMISGEAAAKALAMVTSSGGEVLAGGRADGNRMEATLVVLPDFAAAQAAQAALATQEVFAPVLTASPFDDLEDALGWINRGHAAIHASLYTQDETLIRLAESVLEVSGLIVNDAPTVRFDSMPYGGERRAGIGREGVAYAMREFTTPRVTLRRK